MEEADLRWAKRKVRALLRRLLTDLAAEHERAALALRQAAR